MKYCDMCGSEIADGKCHCGRWENEQSSLECPMKKGLEKFHEMRQFVLSGDAPHLGCSVIYFRGDYNDCDKIKEFIYKMKNRPYYNEK